MKLSTKQNISKVGWLGTFLGPMAVTFTLALEFTGRSVTAGFISIMLCIVLVMIGIVGNTLVNSHVDPLPPPLRILDVPNHNNVIEWVVAHAGVRRPYIRYKCECGHLLAESYTARLYVSDTEEDRRILQQMRNHQYRNSYPLVEILKDDI